MRKKGVVLVENNNINTTTTETEVNTDFSTDLPSTSSASASSMNNSSLPVEDVSENIQIVSSAPAASTTTRMKKYRQLVNRSKMKLLHGAALQSKTRRQKSKLGLVKRDGVCSASGYKLIACICKYCKKLSSRIVILEDCKARKGLAQSLLFKCENCAAETSTYASKKVNNGISAFDINLLSTYASLSFGREGLAKFCGIMDLPPQVLMDSYNKLSKKLGEESQKIAESSMKDTAKRLIDEWLKIHVFKTG